MAAAVDRCAMQHLLGSVRSTLRPWFPQGDALDERTWMSRHRILQRVLIAHIPGLALVGLLRGTEDAGHLATELLIIVAFVLFGRRWPTRRGTTIATSAGLAAASAILVHLTGGLIEAHFHFFVMLPLVALYVDWRPLTVALGFVLLHHGVTGTINPEAVYNHPAAIERPVLWAIIHAAFIAGLIAVLVINWHFVDRTRRSLTASESQLRASFEAAPIGMAMLSGAGIILQANAELGLMAGVAPSQLSGKRFMDLVDSHGDEESVCPLRTIFDGGSDRVQCTVRFKTPVGSARLVEVAMCEFTGPDARRRLVAQFKDVTAEHRSREHLEELVRLKDRFVASVSHELRTPLTAVVGYAEILRSSTEISTTEREEILDVLASQSRDVADIVEDLLVSARADIGMVSIKSSVVDVCAEIGSLSESMVIRGLDAPRFESVGPVRVWADPTRLRQVLRNLLSNAARYGGPDVAITLSAKNHVAQIEISDDGSGVPESDREAVFEPYRRAAESPTSVDSIGLGLSVARQLARLMDGDLEYSYRDGRSRFLVTLPVAVPHEVERPRSRDLTAVQESASER